MGYRLRRIGLGVFFASVAVNAGLGIYALLMPHFGPTQRNILLTSLCVTGAVLLALACEPAWERRLLEPVPFVGTLAGTVAFAGAIAGIWTSPTGEAFDKVLASMFVVAIACAVASLLELARSHGRLLVRRVLTVTVGLLALAALGWIVAIWVGLGTDNLGGKASGSTFTIGVACAASALLSFTRLAPGHRWVLTVTLGLLTLGASMLTVVYWLGDDPSEIYVRAMGVVLVAFAAFAVTVPVLHWMDRSALAVAGAAASGVRFCPHCGRRLAGDVGQELACSRCGRRFRVVAAGGA